MIFTTPYKEDVGYRVCAENRELMRHFIIFNDSGWIDFIQIDKQDYIDMLKKLGAINQCTREFPSMYFKTLTETNNAIINFYEPMVMVRKLIA